MTRNGPTTRDSEIPGGGGGGEAGRLRRLLEEQRELCRSLDTLGLQQEACIQTDDTDGLLRVLAERQVIVDRVTHVSGELEPLRVRKDEILAAISEQQRAEVKLVVGELNELADRITRRDDAQRVMLEAKRARLAEQIAGVNRGRGAMAAYASRPMTGNPPPARARFEDRQG